MKRLPHAVLCLALAAAGLPGALYGETAAEAAQGRRVPYGETDVVTIRTKVRFTTMVILPKEETILDYTCGDRDFWVVDGTGNLAYIKPARAGARTNVNLVTASGNVYSLLLEEVSESADGPADLKIFIQPKEASIVSSAGGAPRFVPFQEVAGYREQYLEAKAAAREARAEAERAVETAVSRFVADYPAQLEFGYEYRARKKPFYVAAIWNDGRFTYIQADSKELPALYEIQDGKPGLVNFDCSGRLITVHKIIDHGYLSIGKEKLYFKRKEDQ